MLSEERIEENYNKYIELLKTNIQREGIENLIKWLNAQDTKVAPASGKYHCAYKGGLVEHSLNVYKRLKNLLKLEYTVREKGEDGQVKTEYKCPYSEETITLVSLLHDISKINYYEQQFRNVKDEKGDWRQVPFYQSKESKNRLIFGSHCMNSLYMVGKFFKLNYEEELAILYHMGAMDSSDDKITVKNTAEVYAKSTLALLLHHADMEATYIDESREEE